MKIIGHSYDTAINTFAYKLNEALQSMINFSMSEELQMCNDGEPRDVVIVSRKRIIESVEDVITKLNHDEDDELFPVVLVGQSLEVSPSSFGTTLGGHSTRDSITVYNEDDESDFKRFKGRRFEFESAIQIVIMAREQNTVRELSLWIIDFLQSNKKIGYKLLIQDTENKTEFSSLDGYGGIKLLGANELTFSETTVQKSGVVSSAMDFKILDSFFALKETEDIMMSYDVQVKEV